MLCAGPGHIAEVSVPARSVDDHSLLIRQTPAGITDKQNHSGVCVCVCVHMNENILQDRVYALVCGCARAFCVKMIKVTPVFMSVCVAAEGTCSSFLRVIKTH